LPNTPGLCIIHFFGRSNTDFFVETMTINGNAASYFLTIVVPAYNEESRLPQTMPDIIEFVQAQAFHIEVLVVDDGSVDRTPEIVREFAAKHNFIRLLQPGHGGKGHAVRAGMLAATGEYVFFADADWAMPVSELPKFLPPCQNGYQVAIGSREGPGANRFNEPGYRHLMGRVFNLIVKLLAVPDFEDTQCGFKCFHRSVVSDLFQNQRIDGFGFDVEVLYLAKKRGYTVVEVPIDWYSQPESKVSPVKDTLRMFQDILTVRKNDREGLYDKKLE
jgi:dolichyl-phosphate beta-glucosyltransferase